MSRAGGNREAGVALVMSMLIVALAVIVATSMVNRQAVDIHRTANIGQADRMLLFALGGEQLVINILQEDFAEGKTDHLQETWALPIEPMEFEGGLMTITIEDLQGRFNLNNLVRADAVNIIEARRLQRLLTGLDIDTEKGQALFDWIDTNIEPAGAAGAEDDVYLKAGVPYRAANSMFVSPTELRLVHGMHSEDVDRLLPHVAALPQLTPVNVNTASARLLMTLAADLGEQDAEMLMDGRGETGYEDIAGFIQSSALAGREVDQRYLAVASSYFLSTIEIGMQQTRMTLKSLIYRDSGGRVSVLMRSRGGY